MLQVLLAHLEFREHPVQLEVLDLSVPQVQQEAQDLSDQPEQPALLVLQEFKALLVLPAQLVLSVLRVLLAHPEFKEQVDLLALLDL